MKRFFASVVLSVSLLASNVQASDWNSLSGEPGETIGRYLHKEKIPNSVSKAVREITKIGREEGDFFGIEGLELFSINKNSAEPRLVKILSDVIHESQNDGDYSLWQFCKTGTDEDGWNLAFDDDNECASYLAGQAKGSRFHGVLATAVGSLPGQPQLQQRMNKAVSALKSFINKYVGHGFEEVHTSMTGLNVSQETVVLINKKLEHVIVIRFNLGA